MGLVPARRNAACRGRAAERRCRAASGTPGHASGFDLPHRRRQRSTGTIGQSNELGTYLAMFMVFAVAVGFVESILARLRLSRVPQLLVGAAALALFGIILQIH